MNLPSDVTLYGDNNYWEQRYKEEDCFDWFATYNTFKQLVLNTIKFQDKILMLGCGNSTLSADMYNDGYHNITNIDYSQVVIDNMTHKYRHMSDMSWKVMDINELEFQDGEFDVILEKGTLDAFLVDEKDPWRISDKTQAQMHRIITQISKKLTPTGKFISITFSQPHFRKPLYGKIDYDWSIQMDTFGETFHFFYYTMIKGQMLSAVDRTIGENYCKTIEHENVPLFNDSDNEDILFRTGDVFNDT